MRQALGKGLDALIPKSSPAPAEEPQRGPLRVPLGKIRPNHLQPRKSFDAEHLSELASSIKDHGLAQPLVVSYDKASDSYELIAGERRLRAAQLAGLSEVDVVVRDPGSEQERLALALIENIQREDLNPIDAALGYLRLMKTAAITQVQMTKLLGKSKSAISNTLRLLELPEEIQHALQVGQLSEGHARALLSIENALERQRIFRIVLEQKISVRETEEAARQINSGAVDQERKGASPRERKPQNPDIRELEDALTRFLGTKVEIKARRDGQSGHIRIAFYSAEDFERIVNIIKK